MPSGEKRMKAYISIDMEGVCGIVREIETDPKKGGDAYQQSRHLMTQEANAAIEGCIKGGATEVLIADSHWNFDNLIPEELHEAATLLRGTPRGLSMMQELDASYDAALFVGYHARAGTPHAILDHTYSGTIAAVRVNGTEVGELGINAALAGVAGVPVAVVSGDSSVAAEARALLGEDVATVVVKQAVSRHAARSVAPAVACRMIREGVAAALTQKHAPLVLPPPITVEVDFALTIHADMAELCPGATRTAGRTVAFTHQDYREVFRGWRAMLNLSAVVE